MRVFDKRATLFTNAKGYSCHICHSVCCRVSTGNISLNYSAVMWNKLPRSVSWDGNSALWVATGGVQSIGTVLPDCGNDENFPGIGVAKRFKVYRMCLTYCDLRVAEADADGALPRVVTNKHVMWSLKQILIYIAGGVILRLIECNIIHYNSGRTKTYHMLRMNNLWHDCSNLQTAVTCNLLHSISNRRWRTITRQDRHNYCCSGKLTKHYV
jgi:hypothetical protein